jgi:uncharacterized protein YgfB (UPF0149 family)
VRRAALARLRVAPLLLFSECGKPLEAAEKPSLH